MAESKFYQQISPIGLSYKRAIFLYCWYLFLIRYLIWPHWKSNGHLPLSPLHSPYPVLSLRPKMYHIIASPSIVNGIIFFPIMKDWCQRWQTWAVLSFIVSFVYQSSFLKWQFLVFWRPQKVWSLPKAGNNHFCFLASRRFQGAFWGLGGHVQFIQLSEDPPGTAFLLPGFKKSTGGGGRPAQQSGSGAILQPPPSLVPRDICPPHRYTTADKITILYLPVLSISIFTHINNPFIIIIIATPLFQTASIWSKTSSTFF